MRTTVDIQQDLLQEIRDEAHRQGVSFKELLNRVIRRGLEASGPKPRPYRCPQFSMGSPKSPIDKALGMADRFEEEERARKLEERR